MIEQNGIAQKIFKNFICYCSFVILFIFSNLSQIAAASDPATNSNVKNNNVTAVSANPAAVNETAGNGELQKAIEKKYCLTNCGFNFDGAWVGDLNNLFSGGVADTDRFTKNSLLVLGLT